MSELDKIIDALGSANLKNEIVKLKAIRQWAIDSLELDYKVGDKVILTQEGIDKLSSNFPDYAPSFTGGRVGIICTLDFSSSWYVTVEFDRLIRESGYPDKDKLTWLGPEDEKPEGMKQYYKSEGTTKVFFGNPKWYKKYVEPVIPVAVKCDCCGKIG